MPIHDQGYQHYTGVRTSTVPPWWVIARTGVRERIRERRCLALLLFAWSPFAVRAVELYLGATMLRGGLFAATEGTFHSFLNQQRLFVFFITIYVGAGLIAADRQSNALQIYLSKPISRSDYIAGKLLTVALFLVAVTWLPATLLLVLQVLFTGSVGFVMDHPGLLPAITLASALQVALASLTMIALSSLSRSRRFAAMVYAGVVLFTAALHRVLEGITGNPAWVLISPQNTWLLVTDAIFGVASDGRTLVVTAVAALIAVMIASLVVVERRVRAVDVVA